MLRPVSIENSVKMQRNPNFDCTTLNRVRLRQRPEARPELVVNPRRYPCGILGRGPAGRLGPEVSE